MNSLAGSSGNDESKIYFAKGGQNILQSVMQCFFCYFYVSIFLLLYIVTHALFALDIDFSMLLILSPDVSTFE